MKRVVIFVTADEKAKSEAATAEGVFSQGLVPVDGPNNAEPTHYWMSEVLPDQDWLDKQAAFVSEEVAKYSFHVLDNVDARLSSTTPDQLLAAAGLKRRTAFE